MNNNNRVFYSLCDATTPVRIGDRNLLATAVGTWVVTFSNAFSLTYVEE